MRDTDNIRETVRNIVHSRGLEYRAEFIPGSRTNHDDPDWECVTWRITLSVPNGGNYSTEYRSGIACIPVKYDNKARKLRTIAVDEQIKRAIETGSPRLGVKVPDPDLVNVLYCLVSDAGAIDYSCFQDWADDFGYDVDSRKAEKIYRTCLEIGLWMRSALGEKTLAELREALADY